MEKQNAQEIINEIQREEEELKSYVQDKEFKIEMENLLNMDTEEISRRTEEIKEHNKISEDLKQVDKNINEVLKGKYKRKGDKK